MWQVVEVNRVEELDAYRSAWQSLLSQTPGASFFQSLEWLEQYWQHFGSGRELCVLFVFDGERPIGVLPLTILREPTQVGPIRVLTYPLEDFASFYGPIGPTPAATLTEAMRYLRQRPRDWDAIDLRWTDTDGTDGGRTRRAMRASGFQGIRGDWQETVVIELDGTWKEYLAGRVKKFRQKIGRQSRRFDELGDVQYVRYRPLGLEHGEDDPRWDWYDGCVELARESWQGSSTTGVTLSHESVREHFRQTHALAARSGTLDMNLLLRQGEVIAFLYCYHLNGHICGFKTAYDPRHAKIGLGNVLYAKTIEDSFRRGDRDISLGSGSVEVKRPWATRVVRTHRYVHYPMSVPRTQLLRAKRLWENWRAEKDARRSAAATTPSKSSGPPADPETTTRPGGKSRCTSSCFRRGALMQVRSQDEILATLDAEGKLDGMPFMPEMLQYCGQQFQIHRRADRVFLDHHYYVAEIGRTVLLEGTRCDGESHDGCQMNCLAMWKEDWLTPVTCAHQSPCHEPDEPCRSETSLPVMKNETYFCQATELVTASSPLPWWDVRQYVRDLLRREVTIGQFARMALRMAYNRLQRTLGRDPSGLRTGPQQTTSTCSLDLKPGELVEIKSEEEIAATLDNHSKNRGLGFGPDMAALCGRKFRVQKRVEKMIIEWSGEMAAIRNTVVLDGATCDGVARRGCPRDCHHLWREIWLKRVEQE